MNAITVKLDLTPWTTAVRQLNGRMGAVQARIVNRSASTTRTGMTRLIAADMKLKAGTVRERIALSPATKTFTTATLTFSGKRIPLIDFGARGPEPSRGKGRGVTAKTATRRYPSAFLAQMRSGHRGVYQRKGPGRLPIRELFGASVAGVAVKYFEQGVKIAHEALVKNAQSECRFALIESAQKG